MSEWSYLFEFTGFFSSRIAAHFGGYKTMHSLYIIYIIRFDTFKTHEQVNNNKNIESVNKIM